MIASSERLIPYRPKSSESYTKLSLKHAPKASDTAIAGLIHSMPNLEEINLKGSTLAGTRTVDIICKKCKSLKRLNLKGTNVNEQEMRDILDRYGQQLEVFKIDRVMIEVSPDEQRKDGATSSWPKKGADLTDSHPTRRLYTVRIPISGNCACRETCSHQERRTFEDELPDLGTDYLTQPRGRHHQGQE